MDTLFDEALNSLQSDLAGIVELERTARDKPQLVRCENNGVEGRFVCEVEGAVDEDVSVARANGRAGHSAVRRARTTLPTAFLMNFLPIRLSKPC